MPSKGRPGIGEVQSLDSRRPSAESYSTRQYLPLSPVSTKSHGPNSRTLPSPRAPTTLPDVSPVASMETYMVAQAESTCDSETYRAQAESTIAYQTAQPVIAILKSFLLFAVFIASLYAMNALELHSAEIKANFFDLSQGTKSMLFIAVLTPLPYAAWRIELPGKAPGAHQNTWMAMLILFTLLYLGLAEKFGWWPLLSGEVETSARGWLSLGGESILFIALCTALIYAARLHLQLARGVCVGRAGVETD